MELLAISGTIPRGQGIYLHDWAISECGYDVVSETYNPYAIGIHDSFYTRVLPLNHSFPGMTLQASCKEEQLEISIQIDSDIFKEWRSVIGLMILSIRSIVYGGLEQYVTVKYDIKVKRRTVNDPI